jgi:predicted  nucleic acid-binding Zn-ribbon protein
MMSDHKKTAELRVTREATKRYAIEVSDLEMKVNALQKNTSNARSKSGVLSDGVSGISISEKENKLNNEKQPSLATSSSVNVAADISSLEHTNDVRDILLRANLGKNWFSY